jgi:hypothetical protein
VANFYRSPSGEAIKLPAVFEIWDVVDLGDAGETESTGTPTPAERRADRRYALALECDVYSRRNRRPGWFCCGVTVNWTRNSILMQCQRPLADGATARLVVRWMQGVQLVVEGAVVHSDERGTVVRIVRRRFRGRPGRPWIAREPNRKPPPSDVLQ